MSASPPSPAGPDEINPYEAPLEALPTSRDLATETHGSDGPLRFWEGRRALLQSIFYMRCFALLTTLIALRGLYALLAVFQGDDFVDGREYAQSVLSSPLLLVEFLLNVAMIATTLYFNYVVWQFARKVQAVAAMRQRNPTPVCEDHLWFWRLKVLIVFLALAREAAVYFQVRSML